MKDSAMLHQELEFLQLKLDDAQEREFKQREMYESILLAYSSGDFECQMECLKKESQGKDNEIQLLHNELRVKSTELETLNCQLMFEKGKAAQGNALPTVQEGKETYHHDTDSLKGQISELQRELEDLREPVFLSERLEDAGNSISRVLSDLSNVKQRAADSISEWKTVFSTDGRHVDSHLHELSFKQRLHSSDQILFYVQKTHDEFKRLKTLVSGFTRTVASIENYEEQL